MKLILILAGLALGNFIYQLFSNKDWKAAQERTFFQAVALLGVYLFVY